MTATGIIVALIALLLGFLLGWFIEWRIDLAYWRSYFEEAAPGSEADRDRVMVLPAGATAAQLPPAREEVMLEALREQVAQRDADLAVLRAMIEQLSTTEAHRREQEAGLMDEARRLRGHLDDLTNAKNDADAEWRHELARREQQWQESKESEIAALQTERDRLEAEDQVLKGKFDRYRANHPSGLATIRGIGPKLEADLRKVGIHTYADLAARTPDELRTLLNPPNWRKLNFEDWIEQARILARAEEEELQLFGA